VLVVVLGCPAFGLDLPAALGRDVVKSLAHLVLLQYG
jgi:hypothetical protein